MAAFVGGLFVGFLSALGKLHGNVLSCTNSTSVLYSLLLFVELTPLLCLLAEAQSLKVAFEAFQGFIWCTRARYEAPDAVPRLEKTSEESSGEGEQQKELYLSL